MFNQDRIDETALRLSLVDTGQIKSSPDASAPQSTSLESESK